MENHILGMIAATLTTVSFVPQVIKTIISRDTSGISFWMYLLFSTGVLFWMLYGFTLQSPPMIYANMVTLTLALVILVMKLRELKSRKGTGGRGQGSDSHSSSI